MAWITPKTDWTLSDGVADVDLNRIEGNISALKTAATIDIVDSGAKYTATNVEDALQEIGSDLTDGKASIASAITTMGATATSADSMATLASEIQNISKDATAAAGDLISGKSMYSGGVKVNGTLALSGNAVVANVLAGNTFYTTDPKTKLTGTMVNNAGIGKSASWANSNGDPYVDVTVPQNAYYSTTSFLQIYDADLIPNNIVSGKNIMGVNGTYAGYATGDTVPKNKISNLNVVNNALTNPSSYNTSTGAGAMTFVAGDGTYIYISTSDGYLRKYNRSWGLIWSVNIGYQCTNIRFLSNGDVVASYYYNSADTAISGKVVKISATTGAVTLTYFAGNAHQSYIDVDPSDNVYLGIAYASGTNLYKWNAAGTLQWSKATGWANEDLQTDGTIVGFYDPNSVIYAYDCATGGTLKVDRSDSSMRAFAAGGGVGFGANTYNVFRVDDTSNTMIWYIAPDGTTSGIYNIRCDIYSAANDIYVGYGNNYCYRIDFETGATLQKYDFQPTADYNGYQIDHVDKNGDFYFHSYSSNISNYKAHWVNQTYTMQ